MIRAASMALGLTAMMEDLGLKSEEHKVTVKTDASAAKGIASREGLGKVRHMEVSQLWLQEKVMRKEVRAEKVVGGENLADALTKHISREDLEKHLRNMDAKITDGRQAEMPST